MPCRKQTYKSKGAADAHLRSLLQKGNDLKNSGDLCTYYHRGCGWHVGHRSSAKFVEESGRITIPLFFDGEYLWLESPDCMIAPPPKSVSSVPGRARIGKRRASGAWSFFTMGAAHGDILDELLGGDQ